eukprot:GILK01010336.1.p1 GENE.GILK01010336.1~~GILK01010336.1.p1  ORF type:complete len:810 (-),score=149.44 GILK01010336.1:275-2626(-)
MAQRTSQGLSYLDCVKAAVEHFLRIRSRDPSSRQDRYFLVTCSEGSVTEFVLSGWSNTYQHFMNELKNIGPARDLTNLGIGIARALDVLNKFRHASGVDNFGQGRTPWFLEPGTVAVFTDGCPLTSMAGVSTTLTLPLAQTPGSELVVEPFRWDQRIFAFVTRFAGMHTAASAPLNSIQVNVDKDAVEREPVFPMTDVTGGRCFVVSNFKSLLQAVESVATKIPPTVCMSFEPLPVTDNGNGVVPMDVEDKTKLANVPVTPVTPSLPGAQHIVIFVRSSTGTWPIPEWILPTNKDSILPPRSAQPVLYFSLIPTDPRVPENFPVDRYELEQCGMTQKMIHIAYQSLRKGEPRIGYGVGPCYPVYITSPMAASSASGPVENGLGTSFGYLRVNKDCTAVDLHLMCYNYKKLFSLLEDVIKQGVQVSAGSAWRQRLDQFLHEIPFYYFPAVKAVLKRFGLFSTLIDVPDTGLHPKVVSYLKRLKTQATEQIQQQVQQAQQEGKDLSTVARKDVNNVRNKPLGNVFDIPRESLLEQVEQMRLHCLGIRNRKQEELESNRHSVPISVMGNYHEALMKRAELRNPFTEEGDVPRQLFGNPFRRLGSQSNQPKIALVDEADEATQIPGSPTSPQLMLGRKRRLQSPIRSNVLSGTSNGQLAALKAAAEQLLASSALNEVKPEPMSKVEELKVTKVPWHRAIEATERWHFVHQHISLWNQIIKNLRRPGPSAEDQIIRMLEETVVAGGTGPDTLLSAVTQQAKRYKRSETFLQSVQVLAEKIQVAQAVQS